MTCANRLQQLSAVDARRPPAAAVRFVVHGLLGWLYVHTMHVAGSVDWRSIDFPTINQVHEFMRYMLTLWTLSMHLGFFLTASSLDFFELLPLPLVFSKLLNKIRKVNDFLFITVMLPISMCVCSGFWSAWVLNSEGIYPTALNDIIPVWINHVSHTTPIFVVFFELLFCYHPSPKIKSAVASLLTVETIYLLTLITLRVQYGRWVYLLIDIYVNTMPKVIVMFSFLSYIVPTIYLVGCLRFNNYFWGIKTNERDLKTKLN